MEPLSITQVRERVEWVVMSRLAIVDALVGGLVASAIGSALLGSSDAWTAIGPGIISTGVLALEALRRTLRHRDPRLAAVPYALLGAVLNAPASLGLSVLAMACHAPPRIHGMGELFLAVGLTVAGLLMVAVVALFFTVPLGIAYGVAHQKAVGVARDELSTPTLRALQRARTIVVTYELVGVIAGGIVVLARQPSRTPVAIVGVLGAMLVLDVSRWMFDHLRRRRWLTALRADRLARYRLVPQSECRVSSDRAPLEPADDSFVAVVEAAPGMPYRDVPEAVMLVPAR